jgi:hypothetical protein
MTAVEYQWHRALTCTDTRSDHWVAVSVCGCAEYILSTSPQGPEVITARARSPKSMTRAIWSQ